MAACDCCEFRFGDCLDPCECSQGYCGRCGRCDVHCVCAVREPEFLLGADQLSWLPWPADGGR
jgi:hypothetical protein